ncbi:hypothetical protein ACXC9Q_02785 [Kribbella sp. CWNU-51]
MFADDAGRNVGTVELSGLGTSHDALRLAVDYDHRPGELSPLMPDVVVATSFTELPSGRCP